MKTKLAIMLLLISIVFFTKISFAEGGAPMPYCMYFHGGYALHASSSVPGYNASHGCIRLFYDDALWLNKNFVDTSSKKKTKIIIQP